MVGIICLGSRVASIQEHSVNGSTAANNRALPDHYFLHIPAPGIFRQGVQDGGILETPYALCDNNVCVLHNRLSNILWKHSCPRHTDMGRQCVLNLLGSGVEAAVVSTVPQIPPRALSACTGDCAGDTAVPAAPVAMGCDYRRYAGFIHIHGNFRHSGHIYSFPRPHQAIAEMVRHRGAAVPAGLLCRLETAYTWHRKHL